MQLQLPKLESFLGKKKNIVLLYIIVIVGVLFLAFGRNTPAPKKEETRPSDTAALESVLERMEGVGRVRVAVTYDTGTETVPLTDANDDAKSVVVLGSGKDARVAAQVEIMPRIRGVLVVAEGGGDKNVRADIINAVRALYDVPTHKIAVFAAK